MDNHDETRLNTLLERRQLTPASSDLAQRIIAASRQMQQPQAISFGIWISSLLNAYIFPKPTYALAILLMLGFLVGFISPAIDTASDTQEASYVNEILNYDEVTL